MNRSEHVAPKKARRALPRAGAALGLLGACVLLVGCGGSSKPSGSTGASSSAASQGSRQETQRLKFTQCMREHGVNLPDKETTGAPSPIKGVPASTLQSALAACGKYQAASSASSPAQQSELREAIVAYARCLRENGLNVPEPTGTDLTALAAFRQAILAQERSPSFRQANSKCHAHLPTGG